MTMRHMLFAAVLGCLANPVYSQSQAGDTGLESLQTGDAVRGWEAVGRVDFGAESFCTGTLIDTTDPQPGHRAAGFFCTTLQ